MVYSQQVEMFEGIMQIMTVMFCVSLVMFVLNAIANWVLFAKAGKPGWASLIPFYGSYCLFDIAMPGKGWHFLLMLIPFYNIYLMIKLNIELSKKFGKPALFAAGLLFFPVVFMSILAFGKSVYGGVQTHTMDAYSEDAARERIKQQVAKRKESENPFDS